MPWFFPQIYTLEPRKKLNDSIKKYYSSGGKSNLSNVIVHTYHLVEILKETTLITEYNKQLSIPIHEIVATRTVHSIEKLIRNEEAFTDNMVKQTIEVLECYSKSLYRYMKHYQME